MSGLDNFGSGKKESPRQKSKRAKGFFALDELGEKLRATPGALSESPIQNPERIAHSLSSAATHESPVSANPVVEELESEKVVADEAATVATESPKEPAQETSTDTPPESINPLEHARGNLASRLEKLTLDDDHRSRLSKRIDAANTRMRVARMSRELGALESRVEENENPPALAENAAVVSPELERSRDAARETLRRLADERVMSAEVRAKFEEGVVRSLNKKDRSALKAILRGLPKKEKSVDEGEPEVKAKEVVPADTGRFVDNSPYTQERLADALEHLGRRLKSLPIGADQFEEIGRRLVAATDAPTVRALAKELDGLEKKHGQSELQKPTIEIPPTATEKAPTALPRDTHHTDMGLATGVPLEDLLSRLAKKHMPKRHAPTGPKIRQMQQVPEAPISAAHSTQPQGPEDSGESPEHKKAREKLLRLAIPQPQRAERVRTPGQVVGDETPQAGAHVEAPFDWTIKRKEFAGLTVKTVREILANEYDAKNFGELVESLDPGGLEIMRKSIADQSLTALDRKILNYARHEYARRIEQIKFINSKITVADLETVGRRDEDFAAVLGLEGPARTAELFKKQVLQMGMMDKPSLDRLYGIYKNLTTLRDTKNYQNWERDIRTLCKQAGTSVNEFDYTFDLTTKESRRESQDALAAKFRKSYGPFRKLVDMVIPISQRKAGKLMRKAVRVGDKLKPSRFSPQSFFVRGVDTELNKLTEVLKYTIVDNEEVVHMMEQEAWRNKNLMLNAEKPPRTYAEAESEKVKAPKAAADIVKERVEEYRTPDGLRDWDHATVGERARAAAQWRHQEEVAEQAQGTGWFARAMAAFFQSLFATEVSNAVKKPVLA